MTEPEVDSSSKWTPRLVAWSGLVVTMIPLTDDLHGPFLEATQAMVALILVIATLILTGRHVAWGPENARGRRNWLCAAGGGLVAAALFGWQVSDTVAPLFLLALAGMWREAGQGPVPVFRPILIGVALITAARFTDEIFLWSAGITSAWDAVVGAICEFSGHTPQLASFSYGGGWILLGFIGSLMILVSSGGQSGLRRLMQIALLVPAFWLIGRHVEQPAELMTFSGLAVLVALALGLWRRPRRLAPSRPRLAAAMVVAFAAIGLVPVVFTSVPSGEAPTIGLVKGHYSRHVPSLRDLSPARGASLGYFERFLARSGRDFSFHEKIDDELLEKECIVVCNLEDIPSEDRVDALERYVEEGGVLVVFGDHTDIAGVMKATNPVIERFGIELLFDSAMPMGRKSWTGSIRLACHPLLGGCREEDEVRISVGASLALRDGAQPLIVGRAGYSDWGDEGSPERAYLGDWQYNAGVERIGDLILAARASRGRGEVIVFADTAILQETSFSEAWKVSSSLISWVDTKAGGPGVFAFASILLVALGLGLPFVLGARPVFVLAAILFSMAGGIWSEQRALAVDAALVRPAGTAWFWIPDGTTLTMQGRDEHSVDSFASSLAALDYLPLFESSDGLHARPDSDLVVVLPGAGVMSEDHVERLESFANAGGRVLVACGYEERAYCDPLFSRLGLRLMNLPLGRAPQTESAIDGPAPGGFSEAWAFASEGSDGEVLAECWGRPLVMRFPMGEGEIVAVADTGFATDRCFKTPRGPRPQKVAWLGSLLQ